MGFRVPVSDVEVNRIVLNGHELLTSNMLVSELFIRNATVPRLMCGFQVLSDGRLHKSGAFVEPMRQLVNRCAGLPILET